ncbi:MAG: TonB-dependent receptor, partial [Pedobacter sp.]
KGTTKIVTTDANGKFSITVPGNTTVLVVSYIGFITREVSVGTSNQISISLKPVSNTMDEVTIIGYGTQSKKDNTGAVTSFDAEKQLKDIPNNSAEQALVGRLAGVQIGASEGSLDADYRIVIRGGGSITQDNSPLYIIDGIQVEDGLKSLSPQDIERIDVLKDASSTAIYGSRGANGVVLITTKSGKAGTTTVSYNGIFGINKLNSTLPVMTPYEFVVYQWERTRIEGATNQASFSGIYKVNTFADIDRFYNVNPVNWQEEVMGNDAQMLTNNVSINGGKGDRTSSSYKAAL